MSFKSLILSAAMIAASPLAADIVVEDAYARASTPTAKAGAAFLAITNTGDAADRLLSASSDVAARVELHTHKDMGEGIMKMMQVEEGFVVEAGETYTLARGGDHVMFMGINEPFTDGKVLSVTLTFENAGDVVVDIPVDLDRKPATDHGDMDHGAKDDHAHHH